jgi:hypothetical protein
MMNDADATLQEDVDADAMLQADATTDSTGADSAAIDSCAPTWGDAATFTVGGTVTGLEPTFGLDLLDNGCEILFIGGTSGPFTFPTALPSGHPYSVTVLSSGENCTVLNGIGTMGDADVTNIAVPCTLKDQ